MGQFNSPLIFILLFALAFTVYVVHETHKAHAESATDPARRNHQRGRR